MTARSPAITRAHLADGLTASRFVLALIAVPILIGGSWTAAGAVIAAAWWTDFLDGRVARSTTGSRLGAWDPHADTVVGLGVIIGLAGGGHVPGPGWWLGAAALLTVAYTGTGIFAVSEMIQAVGYGPLLWLTATNRSIGFVVLIATITAILVLDLNRFRAHTLPAFFAGIRTLRSIHRRRSTG